MLLAYTTHNPSLKRLSSLAEAKAIAYTHMKLENNLRIHQGAADTVYK